MDFKAGQMIADKYILDGELGQGGIATVYKMHHVKLETPFALKILKISTPSLKQRLELEAKVQAKIRHPNVVSVLDVIEEEGFLGLVMEFVEGTALDSFLLQERLTLDEAEEIFLAILDAMEEAHDNSIVHRDLKPGNVMIQKKRGKFQIKVCDFGLAKALDDEGASNTVSGTTMGTPAYMAPEQVRNSKTVDQKADIFSLGAILYEMVSGQRAFTGTTTWEILSAVTEKQPPSIKELMPDIPDRFASAINGALQKQVAKRIPSCTEFREVLLGRKHWSPSKADSLIMDGFNLMSGEYSVETADLDIESLSSLEAAEQQEVNTAETPPKGTNSQTLIAKEATTEPSNSKSEDQSATKPAISSAEPSSAPSEETTAHSSAAPVEQENSSSNRLPIIAAIVLLIGGGAAFFGMGGDSTSDQKTTSTVENSDAPSQAESAKPSPAKEKQAPTETEKQAATAPSTNSETPDKAAPSPIEAQEQPTETPKTTISNTNPPAQTVQKPKDSTTVPPPQKNTTTTVKKESTAKAAPTEPTKKLDAAAAKQVVGQFDQQTRKSRKIKDCFASQQKLSGTAPTRVPLIITLANTGKVVSATVTEGEYAGSSFETCLETSLKSLQYTNFDPEAKPLKFKYTIK